MEKIALNDKQLEFLARGNPHLDKYFEGVFPCDRLPPNPDKSTPKAYIVNTDPEALPGRHWLGLWTEKNKCEVMDSYALPLDVYKTTAPLQAWLDKHWKYVVNNGRTLQSLFSQSCGDYALLFLIAKARNHSMSEFVQTFDQHDYVANDHKIGQVLKRVIERETQWHTVSARPLIHNTVGSKHGVRHLLND